ncbi:hypothetical protein KIMH_03890 [Bombiscardovia apis]|uniref:Integrase n=1 Tax=Bombiscardovia apis TaxID=2932182 RepID=A0ABN6SF23_9BIFI|nr:hypothetical protein KIMH_03890 [Bombiscardovia apis]
MVLTRPPDITMSWELRLGHASARVMLKRAMWSNVKAVSKKACGRMCLSLTDGLKTKKNTADLE